MQQNQANANSSTSSTSNLINRRRPHVWQDDMAEVKETFRRVARARHSRGYSAGETSPTRVTAPMLSRNRRARIRCQVPVKALHMSPGCLQVPIKVLQEIQGNRSQSPFVSLNHLQNVLGMCRRIRSQQSLTERKKNPHDPGVYPVYVRRPWSVSACMCHKSQVHPNYPRDISPKSPNLVNSNHSRLHFRGYAHISPDVHNAHVISSQHDVIPGHVKANAHNQCCIENIDDVSPSMKHVFNDISPSAKHRAAHVSSNCHVNPNCHTSPNCHVNPNAVNNLPFNPYPHSSPNDPSTPLYYKPARFKPLYDISNGVFPHTRMRKRASAVSMNEKIRTSAQEKPIWTHYKKLILHPSVEDPQHVNPAHAATDPINVQQELDFNNVLSASLHATPFAWNSPESLIITKKPRTRSSPMGLSESWPSSSSFSYDPHHHQIHFADDFRAHFNCTELADFLNSDRRPHSENDLNLHSASYFLERPPSRCMKRPLSSCSSSWRNVSAFLQGNCMDTNLECGFADAWSPNTSNSQQDVSIFIPRDLNGNILRDLPCSFKGNTSLRFKQTYTKNDTNNAEHKRRSYGGAVSDLAKKHKAACTGQKSMQRGKHVYNSSSKGCAQSSMAGSVTKKKPIMASTSSCLDDLEGLPPSKWAKKLASDVMGPYRAKANSTSDYCKQIAPTPQATCSFGNGFKHRVKFASPSVQINNDGFRKEAQSLAAAEMIPDLLSWERDSGLLTGDPPAIVVLEDEEDEELDQKLLEQVEAMLDASTSSSSRSPYPSPSRERPIMSPMHVCSPVRHDFLDSCSKSLTEMELSIKAGGVYGNEAVCGGYGIQQEDDEKLHLQQESQKQHAEKTEEGTSCVDDTLSKEQVKPGQASEKEEASVVNPHVNGSVINIHHNVALIEVMESKCHIKEMNMHACEEDQVEKNVQPLPTLSREMKNGKELEEGDRGLLERQDEEQNPVRRALEEEDIDEGDKYVCAELEVNAKGDQCALDPEWELEKLFQDSLDLNPTLRHLYDTMSHLNSSCAAPVLKQIPSS